MAELANYAQFYLTHIMNIIKLPCQINWGANRDSTVMTLYLFCSVNFCGGPIN